MAGNQQTRDKIPSNNNVTYFKNGLMPLLYYLTFSFSENVFEAVKSSVEEIRYAPAITEGKCGLLSKNSLLYTYNSFVWKIDKNEVSKSVVKIIDMT